MTHNDGGESRGAVSKSPSKDTDQRNIAICSDGTWQKGGQATPTNVWRTYLAIEQENQFKFHDDGVGSGGNKLQRVVGGAFGFGITRNIAQLIESLIMTYKPGTQIYLFGFSRGAFTVRVLADLICRFGIPRHDGASPEEVSQKANNLLIAYKKVNWARRKGADKKTTPSIQPTEQELESSTLTKSDREHIKRVQGELHEKKDDFAIRFMGCWDTVEAVGLPTYMLKQGFIRYLFPLRFADQYPSKKVKHLCHALCLDDERHTFHPLLWHTPPDGLAKDQTLDQVWFPGGHAHVGGGYAKDQLALTPLEWILSKADKAGLRLDETMREQYRAQAYRHGELHPSRPGVYKFYSYKPRRLSELFKNNKGEEFKTDLEQCKVHASVLDRISKNTDSYAPTAIDVPFTPVENEGHKIDEDDEVRKQRLAKRELPDVFKENILDSHSYIKWGEHLYKACLAAWGLLFVWCLVWNTNFFGLKQPKPRPVLGFVADGIDLLLRCIYSAEHCLLNVVEALVPGFIGGTAIHSLKNLPGTVCLFTIGFGSLLLFGRWLRRRIADSALAGWHDSGILAAKQDDSTTTLPTANVRVPGGLLDLNRVIFAVSCFTGFVIFTLLGWQSFHAHLRTDVSEHATVSLDPTHEPRHVVEGFETNKPQFPSGVFMQEGSTYRVQTSISEDWIDPAPFFYEDVPVKNPGGYEPKWIQQVGSRTHFLGPRKRFISTENGNAECPIFMLLGSIGAGGKTIPIGEDATFVASESGHFYLFVNDYPGFYDTNVGRATVTIDRVK